ncbi:MAG TPA: ArsA-related P-loop ATPase [Solirubrobacteraceae bacterium]
MQGLLDRSLLVVTGKGGVGKTTVAAALGLLAAGRGRHTTVVELGEQSRLSLLFGRRAAEPGSATELTERLSSLSVDMDRALLEWLQALGGRVSGRVLASSGTFQYFTAAAPGAKELITMVKIANMTRARGRGRGRAAARPLVILDAPATGHALGMLRSPETFGAIARVGPVARQTAQLGELLRDHARSAYIAVAQGAEMAVTETLELQQGLVQALGRELDAVVVNALLPRRFSAEEMRRIEALAPSRGRKGELFGAAMRAAREVHERGRYQHGQLARLRRRGMNVKTLPFHWGAELDLAAVRELAEKLGREI